MNIQINKNINLLHILFAIEKHYRLQHMFLIGPPIVTQNLNKVHRTNWFYFFLEAAPNPPKLYMCIMGNIPYVSDFLNKRFLRVHGS